MISAISIYHSLACIGSYEASHTFGGSVIPILMDYVKCSGSELSLWDCLHFTHSYSGCIHSDDAGVRCQPGSYTHYYSSQDITILVIYIQN